MSRQQSALPKEPRNWSAPGQRAAFEDLITDLLDISRLESGRVTPDRNPFPLATLFDTLGTEFTALAREQGVSFRVRGSKLRVDSDIRLLRRVLQNFTNAFRYAKGRVVLGVRRQGSSLRLEDSAGQAQGHLRRVQAPGQPPDPRRKGPGAGPAIADGLTSSTTRWRCVPGRARAASSVSPCRSPAPSASHARRSSVASRSNALTGTQVLCIDNEDSILVGMNSLLTRWGCQVWTASNRADCEALLADDIRPQLVLVDYHLDEGQTGTELMAWLRTRLSEPVPGVVISADARPSWWRPFTPAAWTSSPSR